MALTATMFHWKVTLSDVDRSVYETLDLRLARHPSETMRYLLTRTIAYCLSYEEGIVWSRGGISSTEEPPISIRDATGVLTGWIEIGAPSAERLHKATKAASRVQLFTNHDTPALLREASTRAIHRVESIDVWRIDPAFLDSLEPRLDRNSKFELVRNGEQLYVTIGTATLEGAITRLSLVAT